MNYLKYFAILFIAMLGFTNANAKFLSAELQVSGLTCSMCQLATEKALRTLDFISDIKPNLNNNTYVITFRKDKKVEMDLIKKKVKDAGFSVSNLVAVFDFDKLDVKNDTHFKFAGNSYHFMDVSPRKLDGPAKIKIIDNGFIPAASYKKYAVKTKMGCYKSGVMGSERVYHVTL